MFERFTERSRGVLRAAHDEAAALGHDLVGTEHLLLGMLAEGGGVAARVLAAEGLHIERVRGVVAAWIGGPEPAADAEALATIGIDLAEVTAAVERAFGDGALDRAARRDRRRPRRTARMAPRAKKAIELSLREALSLGHGYIGTEHLLLGIIRLGDGVAYRVLEREVGPPAALRDKVLAELRNMGPPTR